MGSSEIFRTEIKGYNKREVIEYINSLNSQLESLKNELDRTESELEKYRTELDEAEQSFTDDISVDIDAIREQLTAEIEAKIKAEIESRPATSVDNGELESLRAKAAMYDEQKEIIAELMIKAKTDAAAICNDAQIRSDALLSDTFDKFLKARDDFSQMRKNIEAGKAEMDSRIAAVSHYLSDFSRYLDILEQDISNTGDNFKQNM